MNENFRDLKIIVFDDGKSIKLGDITYWLSILLDKKEKIAKKRLAVRNLFGVQKLLYPHLKPNVDHELRAEWLTINLLTTSKLYGLPLEEIAIVEGNLYSERL